MRGVLCSLARQSVWLRGLGRGGVRARSDAGRIHDCSIKILPTNLRPAITGERDWLADYDRRLKEALREDRERARRGE